MPFKGIVLDSCSVLPWDMAVDVPHLTQIDDPEEFDEQLCLVASMSCQLWLSLGREASLVLAGDINWSRSFVH